MADEKKPVEKKEEKKKKEKRGKKARSGRKHSKVELKKFFTVKDGKLERSGKYCPRCGVGTFLAVHKKRDYCGRCGYTEFHK